MTIANKLVQLAEHWPTHASTATDSLGRTYVCERCEECSGAIVPTGVDGRIAHLTLEHGYREDGRRWSNINELMEEG